MRPKERLLRRGITPNEESAMRKALEAWSDRLSHWTEGFTAVVVLGLVIEYLPEITYFLRFIPWVELLATAIQRHSDQLRQLGGFLVIVGVGGELWIDIRASRVETDLREETNEVVARAEERAAEALKAAAEANLARAKIEQRMRPRFFDDAEFKGLRDLLAPLAPHHKARVEIIVFDIHVPEPLIFSDQIASVFVSAGFAIRHWEARAGTRRIVGPSVIIAVGIGHEDEFKELAHVFARALRELDIDCGVALEAFGCQGPDAQGITRAYEFGPPQYQLRVEKPMQFMGIRAVSAFRVEVGAKQLTAIPPTRPVTPPQA